MEGIKEDVNYSDHESKCRICFKAFGSDERQVVVTKVVVRRFQEITEKKVNKQTFPVLAFFLIFSF